MQIPVGPLALSNALLFGLAWLERHRFGNWRLRWLLFCAAFDAAWIAGSVFVSR